MIIQVLTRHCVCHEPRSRRPICVGLPRAGEHLSGRGHLMSIRRQMARRQNNPRQSGLPRTTGSSAIRVPTRLRELHGQEPLRGWPDSHQAGEKSQEEGSDVALAINYVSIEVVRESARS